MPLAKKRAPAKTTKGAPPSVETQVTATLASLKQAGTQRTREGMARYAITSDKAFGVTVGDLRVLAKRIGRNHELALALWDTGWYEARMLAGFIDEPARVTSAQMDRWCRDFDNWAVCDHQCFHLFDRTPHAWAKVAKWSNRKAEFEKRAAFALLASLALHDKKAPDEPFAESLALIENAAADGRNFVKKAVSWALRGIGRRNLALHAPAVALAKRLAESPKAAERWVGKDALRELTSAAVLTRLSSASKKASSRAKSRKPLR